MGSTLATSPRSRSSTRPPAPSSVTPAAEISSTRDPAMLSPIPTTRARPSLWITADDSSGLRLTTTPTTAAAGASATCANNTSSAADVMLATLRAA
jgi:hypothetical protein